MRTVRFVFGLCGVILLTVMMAPAQQSGATANKENAWTIDDIILVQSASQFDVSPDGKWAVWVKSTADPEQDGRVSNLMLTSLTEKKEIQLTRGNDNSSSPKFSPDGKLIAFVSTRKAPKLKEGAQIWLISTEGGEPWPLTNSDRSASSLQWAGNDSIVFAAQEDHTLYESELKEKKDSSVIVDDEEHKVPSRLFRIDAKTKEVVRLTQNTDPIQGWAASRDGKWAVATLQKSLRFVYDNLIRPATFLYNLETGESKQLFTDGKLLPGDMEWTKDGSGFYFSAPFTHDPRYLNATIDLLYFYDMASGNAKQIDLGWDRGLSGSVHATSDGVIVMLADGVHTKLAKFTRNGTTYSRTWLEGEHAGNIFGIVIGEDDRTVVYNHSTASKPAQWYWAQAGSTTLKDATVITDLNPALQKKTIAKTEIVHYKGALNEEVEGILYYPHNYEQGKKYPLLLMIHGGPAGADRDAWNESWAYPVNMMCERGAFVLRPNYHGSSSYGLAWAESIGNGKYYDLEVPDLENGVDYLISKGFIDPGRLASMGWSNGAILTTALTVTNPRYKVASVGAGDVEWISDWGNAHFGASFDNYYFGKSPLEDPQLYIQKSPFFKMDKVVAPTIIYHGTIDTNVPTEQGWLHYRALQQIGKTPVRFVVFPGEPHGLRKLSDQRRKITEDLAWFDRYLFKTFEPPNEAFKKDSPLGIALSLKSAAHHEGQYGKLENGVLVPETVKRGELEIGRFEVTRAQYAAFDKNSKYAHGTENYPASGVSLEQARAYCEWLSKQTGRIYRIGSVKEMEGIYKGAGAGENTLDYWAGYSPNPGDTARLEAKIKELGGAGILLMEVGRFKPSGDPLVFDLGGNVAEWSVTDDGKGKALGGSADLPSDTKLRSRDPGAAYTGFRVVLGAPVKKQ